MGLTQVINEFLEEAKELLSLPESSHHDIGSRDRFAKHLALLVAEKTCILLSPETYNILNSNNELPDELTGKPQDLEKFIQMGAGICGQHVEFAMQVFTKAGIRVRDIQVFYLDEEFGLQNHTFIEAFWDGDWRMIDPTWGFIPHKGSLETALSFETVLKEKHCEGTHYETIPWRVEAEKTDFDIFGYAKVAPEALYYSGCGYAQMRISEGEIPLVMGGKRLLIGRWWHRGIPTSSNKVLIDIPEGKWNLQFDIQITDCPEGIFTLSNAQYSISGSETSFSVRINGPLKTHISFESTTRAGYLTLDKAFATKLEASPFQESSEVKLTFRNNDS
tara:strand:- start:186 stop:1184 length:999 start_codon:yes stop_codon:yes gene_type:complete